MLPFRRLSQRSQRPPRSLDDPADQPKSHEWHDDRGRYIMTFPVHPLPSMQAPFEESMLDATGETGYVPFAMPNKSVEARQQQLCKDSAASELLWNFTYNCHWRNHPKAKFHPLVKTLTQIVFGVHLLHHHLEKSVADVADILLKHVHELDNFLQRANEDIDGSLKDMMFRRKCLKVPMEHVNEFDRLLEDRQYRAQLLDGNIVIERTINRMSAMLNDYLVDMTTFRDGNRDLDGYLEDIGHAWTDRNEDVGRIYSAMCGNTSGWSQFLQSLVAKAEKLGVVLVQVSSYCNEIEKRCGAASRRSLVASRSSSRNSSNSREAARAVRNFANNKPLPTVPNERPPFMISPVAAADPSHDADISQRHARSRRKSSSAEQLRTGAASGSEGSLTRSGESKRSTGAVPAAPDDHLDAGHQPQHDASTTRAQHGSVDVHGNSDRAVRIQDDQPEPYSPADSDTNETVVPKHTKPKASKGELSPPLTGKDSAYSSVSGGSFASPTAPHPRSASAQSSHPRAHFGLFPSSTPSTPLHSASGRHGALSPMRSDQPVYVPPRAQSSLDAHTPASRRLSTKSSLSSLKKIFSKKKHSGDSIAE